MTRITVMSRHSLKAYVFIRKLRRSYIDDRMLYFFLDPGPQLLPIPLATLLLLISF